MNENYRDLFLSSNIDEGDVPELELYMDQIITLIENKLGGERRNPDDKLLTKTMINNYSKDKLLQPIKGKKYSKEHVLMMLMIYHLKSALSIPDIKSFFEEMCPEITENSQYNSQKVREMYSNFSDIRSKTDEELFDLISKSDIDDDTQLFLKLVSLSSAASSAALKLLDLKKSENKNKDKDEK